LPARTFAIRRLYGRRRGDLGAAKPATAAPKISKKAVAYQDHPDGDKQCGKCAQFQPPDACKMVEGPISPEGSCRIFVPVRQS